MNAATYRINGKPDVFDYEEVPDPLMGEDHVLINVEAISIEGGDLSKRRSQPPTDPSHILGFAAAGEIIKTGIKANRFKIGQKVVTFDFEGSHATLRAAPESTTFMIPDGLDVQTAIASFISVGTAALAIHLSQVEKGDRVLVTGATGGVGNAVLQLLANKGIEVYVGGRNPDTLVKLYGYGAKGTILIGARPIHEQVKDMLDNRGVDAFIDVVGGNILLDGMKAVKAGGKVVMISGNANTSDYIDPMYIISQRLHLIGCLLGTVMHEPWVREIIEKSLLSVADGTVRVPVDKVFPLSEVKKAHERAEQKGRLGRVLMVP